MHSSLFLTLLVGGATRFAAGQQDGGLATALMNYTQVSVFRQLLQANAGPFSAIIPPGIDGITFLVPTNDAIDKYYKKSGNQLGSLPSDKLKTILQYHGLAAKLTSTNFTASLKGITVPTLLQDQLYNNRTAGASLIGQFGSDAAKGNVVFLSKDRLNPAKLRLRQTGTPAPNYNLRGGLASDAAITAVDGVWSLGNFQIIDSILEPPAPCSRTIRSLSATLRDLDAALNRSGLWTAVDTSRNLTCLAPSNDAFKSAGNPQSSLNVTDLTSALLFHALPQVTYSNFLQDGLVIKSVQGGDVKVSLVGDDIYFNDAKVISPNLLTNNGLIHILDRIMSPNGTAPTPSSTTVSPSGTSSTATATGTATGTATPGSSGHRLAVGGGSSTWAAVLAVAAAAYLFS